MIARQKPMELIDGKFYRGSEEIKPEFGNKEQIALMHETERRIKALNDDGLIVRPALEIIYRYEIEFKCVCGQSVWKEDESEDRKDIDLTGECKCQRCNKRYKVSKENGDMIVKLIHSGNSKLPNIA